MSRKIVEKFEGKVQIKETLVGMLRSYFSTRHIQSAIHFAKSVSRIEQQGKKELNDDINLVHDSYVIASIFATVASLEANINEVFCDAYEMTTGESARTNKTMPVQLIDKLGRMWQLGTPRTASYSILKKYQIALALVDKPLFEKGENPYQDVNLLVKIRNGLMHYEPKSVIIYSTDEEKPVVAQKFEKMLRHKFELNPLAAEGNPFFPHKCMSYGCCKWGIASSIAFADEFFKRTGIKNRFNSIRSKLLLD